MIEIKKIRCIHQTKNPDGSIKAIKIANLKHKTHWVPFVAIHDDSEVWHVGDHGTLIVKDWFAKEKGWL